MCTEQSKFERLQTVSDANLNHLHLSFIAVGEVSLNTPLSSVWVHINSAFSGMTTEYSNRKTKSEWKAGLRGKKQRKK